MKLLRGKQRQFNEDPDLALHSHQGGWQNLKWQEMHSAFQEQKLL